MRATKVMLLMVMSDVLPRRAVMSSQVEKSTSTQYTHTTRRCRLSRHFCLVRCSVVVDDCLARSCSRPLLSPQPTNCPAQPNPFLRPSANSLSLFLCTALLSTLSFPAGKTPTTDSPSQASNGEDAIPVVKHVSPRKILWLASSHL